MILLFNTVSPMQSLVRPALPGQPMSDAEKQLIAQLDWIDKMAGIYTTAHNAALTLERDDFDYEALELIGDLSWNAGDGAEALADAADQALRDNPLEIEYEARWSAGYEPRAQKVIATLCLGGPTVRISTSLDHHGNAIAEETEGHFSWGVDSGTVDVPEHYHDALQLFWNLVNC